MNKKKIYLEDLDDKDDYICFYLFENRWEYAYPSLKGASIILRDYTSYKSGCDCMPCCKHRDSNRNYDRIDFSSQFMTEAEYEQEEDGFG